MLRFFALLTALVLAFSLSSCIKTDTDIDTYADDVKSYMAGSFMPDLAEIGDYKKVDYFSRKDTTIFPDYSLQLVAEYGEEEFALEKERLADAYTYVDGAQTVLGPVDVLYTLPVEAFSAAGFDFKVTVFDDTVYPKNFGMVGISEETCRIAYLWVYSPDLDYICEADDDKTEKMLEFIEYNFSLE